MKSERPELRSHVEGPADLTFVDAVLDAFQRLHEADPSVSAEDSALFALALSEIATNIARHGTGRDIRVGVDLRITAAALIATVQDTADPAVIDWAKVRMPAAMSESGRGLALAREALDHLAHEVTGEGNTWTLARRRDVQRETKNAGG